MYDKRLYKEILDHFQEDLNLVDYEIKSLLSENNTKLDFDISEFLFAKSKRLRPLVLFLIKDALQSIENDTKKFQAETEENIIKLAAALELLHGATLIHDDIIDNADTRRLHPTLNFKYNSKMAVIAGDYLLSLCLKLLSKINLPQIFEYFSENTLNICKGEIDQFFNKNKVVSIEEYIEKSKNKTSSLFIAGAKSILYLINKEANIPVCIQNAILDYVLNFSLAFQIYDDIENFQNENFEKSSSDIENGIYTLPYLYISQQNYSYGIMDLKSIMSVKDKDKKLYLEALNFSKEYLNNTLKHANGSLNKLLGKYKTQNLQKLAETFKL